MNQAGTFVYASETPGRCHLHNQGYLLMKRAKRVKWQASPVAQCVHIVAGGDPNTYNRQGGAPSATFFRTSLPVVMLALSIRSIAGIPTGYAVARPLGESGPKASPNTG